jgi:lipopolysaccharide/colanic/teichoic acid biosynthesis glycosyltransferase
MQITGLADSTPIAPHSAIASPRPAVSNTEIVRPIPVVREPVLSHSSFKKAEPRQRWERLDRMVNVSLALFGLLLGAPIMLVFAALVKLTSPGPIFYSQARVGLYRRRYYRQRTE